MREQSPERTRRLVLLASSSILLLAAVNSAWPSGAYAVTRSGPAALSTHAQRGRDDGGITRSDVWLLLGTGGLAAWSTEFYDPGRTLRGIDRTGLDWPIDFANTYGDGLAMGPAAVALWGLGHMRGDERATRTGRELSISLAAAWSATWLLKLSIDARRPNGGPHSFPSGHTATAFAAAPVLHRNYGTRVGVVAYTLAALTGVARLEDERHYLADVLVGAAIGVVAGRSVAPGGRLDVAPSTSGSGVGVRVRF